MGMRYLMAICILLLTHLVYSQKDTITINQSDIEIVKKQVYNYQDVRGGYDLIKKYISKQTNQPLNGFYKVIVENHCFYTLYFQQGSKSLNEANNFIRYYKNNKLYKLDVFLPLSITRMYYYSVENFDCNLKKIDVKKKNIYDDSLVSSIKMKQSKKKDKIKWKYKKQKFIFLSNELCL